jgi:thymidylate kinase
MKKLIALYGINNLGKTTQINMLVERCNRSSDLILAKKYPIYDLPPTGPLILEAIKKGNPKNLSPGEIQALFAKNRFDFQPELERILETTTVFAEMYTHTGMAFGIGDGVNKELLLALNEGLRKPDISILLNGQRFKEAVEKGHRFEEDDEKTELIRKIHFEFAEEYGWQIVNANQDKQRVNDQIWEIVKNSL